MPRKTKTAAAAEPQAAMPQIPAELLEKLIPGQSRQDSWKTSFSSSRRHLFSKPWALR